MKKYLPLLTLDLSHGYYRDGCCSGLRIEPTLATQRLLANYRCVFRSLPGGAQIVVATEAGRSWIPLSAGMRFGFRLVLQDPDFGLYTDLSALSAETAPCYINSQVSVSTPVALTLGSHPIRRTEPFDRHQGLCWPRC
jgi:hypothetical protein